MNADDGDLRGPRLQDMRLGLAQIAPSAKALALIAYDVEIVADIGFEGGRVWPVGVWVPDVDKNERAVGLDLRKLYYLKARYIQR